MKAFVLVAILGLVAAAPRPQGTEPLLDPAPVKQEQSARNAVPILRNSRIGPDVDGNFDFRYETGDGTVHEARGTNSGDGIVRVSGTFSYFSPEGDPIDIFYIADENGFQAFGAAVPTPPPIPPHALAQLRAAEEAFSKQGLEVAVGPKVALEEIDVGQIVRAPVARESGGRPG